MTIQQNALTAQVLTYRSSFPKSQKRSRKLVQYSSLNSRHYKFYIPTKNGRQISSVKSMPRVIVVVSNCHACVDSAQEQKGKSEMVNLPKLP